MSTPRFTPTVRGFNSNYVVAAFRSLSGPAGEKFPNPALQDLAFSYRMISEVVPYGATYDSQNGIWANWVLGSNSLPPTVAVNLTNNLHEVRLIFRWPLAQGINAQGRQVYRTLVGGSLQETNEPAFPRPNPTQPSPYDLYFFQPQTYVKLP